MNFYDFPQRNITVLQKYLTDKINHGIRNKEKSFEPAGIDNFVSSLGWDFEILNDYVHNINNYQNIPSKEISPFYVNKALLLKILLHKRLRKSHKEWQHIAI